MIVILGMIAIWYCYILIHVYYNSVPDEYPDDDKPNGD